MAGVARAAEFIFEGLSHSASPAALAVTPASEQTGGLSLESGRFLGATGSRYGGRGHSTRMAELSVASPAIHQLRVVLCGVSRLVWRRLLVTSDPSLAELHDALQIAFDWSDEHVHRFRIHGKDYGIPQWGGMGCEEEDARRIPLSHFRLRCGERFGYEYDFTANWKLDESMQLSGGPLVCSVLTFARYPQPRHGREGVPMRWKVTLVAEVESGQSIEHDIAAVDRDERITPATLGLSIAEGKASWRRFRRSWSGTR